jgi:hypothetical protein
MTAQQPLRQSGCPGLGAGSFRQVDISNDSLIASAETTGAPARHTTRQSGRRQGPLVTNIIRADSAIWRYDAFKVTHAP